jgi:hypothetical protein
MEDSLIRILATLELSGKLSMNCTLGRHLMKPMICEQHAPAEVFDMLHELSLGNRATEFMQRVLRKAKNKEEFSAFRADGTANSATFVLMCMMQNRMAGQEGRKTILEDGDFVSDYTHDVPDLENWDGIALAMLFASDWLLDSMITNIPPQVRSVVISQMPNEQHTRARSLFTH